MKRASKVMALLAVLTLLPSGCGKKATARPPPPQPLAPLPAEVAGFRFGMTVAELEAHCREVGRPNPLVGNDADLRTHTCDGVEVEPGMRLNVFLGFCDGDSRLCEINYWTNHNAALAFPILNGTLVKRYGPPTDTNDTLREDGLEAQCAKGQGKIRRTWWWGQPTAIAGRVLISFDCKSSNDRDQMVSVYFDDSFGVAAQLKFLKGNGSLPFR